MKRDKNLYPLSWQHHNGLMAALLLKKGVQKNADLNVMLQFIHQIRKDELDEHFAAEERVLLKYAEKYPEIGTLYHQMQQEHSSIRQCYQQLESPAYSLIENFYQLLEQHIRFEERNFFPLIEETLSADELNEAGAQLNQLPHQTCTNFPVKFWE